ncbi:MAG: hypothetical protein Q8O94_02745 [bacterium]|nr:hypothetical protein [bacterium]
MKTFGDVYISFFLHKRGIDHVASYATQPIPKNLHAMGYWSEIGYRSKKEIEVADSGNEHYYTHVIGEDAPSNDPWMSVMLACEAYPLTNREFPGLPKCVEYRELALQGMTIGPIEETHSRIVDRSVPQGLNPTTGRVVPGYDALTYCCSIGWSLQPGRGYADLWSDFRWNTRRKNEKIPPVTDLPGVNSDTTIAVIDEVRQEHLDHPKLFSEMPLLCSNPEGTRLYLTYPKCKRPMVSNLYVVYFKSKRDPFRRRIVLPDGLVN